MPEKKVRRTTTKTLKELDESSLRVLASDIRADILSACLYNGGHLSSNLGAVDFTIALLKEFSPEDNDILFDVGHQSYAYKILTGRDISKIRKTNGVSPFNLREESPYDVYSNGHAGDCLSTAIGIAKAKLLSGDVSFTIAVIGDASIENGISYEALDYLASHKELKNLIVVLNDNGMAISKNHGPISSRFAKLRNSRFYFRTSSKLGREMSKHRITWKMFLKLRSLKDHLKNFVITPTVYESLGIKYIGPFDGHDFSHLELAFQKARYVSQKQPVIVHLLTKKGYGYPPAMKDENGDYHGVPSRFDELKFTPDQDFTMIKESLLYGPMKENRKIVLITPAMEKGSGLTKLFEDFPDRCIDVGISEESAVVYASGLALKGYEPIVDIYSTFLQRSYDEIIENVSRNLVKVLFLVERAGLVGEDGSSHHGIYDVSMVRSVPRRIVYMPFDVMSMQYIQKKNKSINQGPVFVRFPKGKPSFGVPPYEITQDVAWLSHDSHKKLFLGVSVMGYELACKMDDSYDKGVLLNLLPEDELLDELKLCDYDEIVFYDPYSTLDGTASYLSDYLMRKGYQGKYQYFALRRDFIPFGQIKDLYQQEKMDAESVYFILHSKI